MVLQSRGVGFVWRSIVDSASLPGFRTRPAPAWNPPRSASASRGRRASEIGFVRANLYGCPRVGAASGLGKSEGLRWGASLPPLNLRQKHPVQRADRARTTGIRSTWKPVRTISPPPGWMVLQGAVAHEAMLRRTALAASDRERSRGRATRSGVDASSVVRRH